MASSGILWIDWTFNTAVRLLYALADLIGISHEEINVGIFVIIGPLLLLASLFANVVLWRKLRQNP